MRAERRRLDPALVAALIRQESSFEPRATSRAGARGLMQIMPAVGRQLAAGEDYHIWDAELLYQPDVSLELGTTHLAGLLSGYAHVSHALAAYNAGSSRAKRWLEKPGTDDPEVFVERIRSARHVLSCAFGRTAAVPQHVRALPCSALPCCGSRFPGRRILLGSASRQPASNEGRPSHLRIRTSSSRSAFLIGARASKPDPCTSPCSTSAFSGELHSVGTLGDRRSFWTLPSPEPGRITLLLPLRSLPWNVQAISRPSDARGDPIPAFVGPTRRAADAP